MTTAVVTYGQVTWVDIRQPTEEDIQFLRSHYSFHPLDLEDCLSRVEHPKLDEYEDYLFFVMHFPLFDHQRQVTRPSEVDFFIGANYLVTIHDGVLKPLVRLFNRCEEDDGARREYMGRGAGRLLYSILDTLVDSIFPMLNKIGAHLREIEEDMFTEDIRKTVQYISLVRRDIIAMRRVIRPQLAVVVALEQKDRPFLQREMEVYWGDVADAFRRAWEILENYREVIEGLADTSDSVASYQINEVMRTLTVISVVMLPLTLLSGIYGMNVALPLATHPWAFFFIIGVMAAMTFFMLWIFYRRGWL
ncbi:MAG TPA: magnesium/cobalt transporter CorA [Caldilineae bacterium]|nr:magnesium/cobalt transporter CorA [Caldilineae bacterium]